MFETQSFQELLRNTIAVGAASSGLAEYETDIIPFLQNLATTNEPILMETEFRKVASSRKGTTEALSSARVLVNEAVKYAAADHRTVLKLSDMQSAYRAKFCQVWPFCK